MNTIANAFTSKAFIPYIMAGDPDLASTENFILTMEKAGADIIEIGIPFSDPIADGPVIQAASTRALQAGTKVENVFDMVASVRQKSAVPLIFMTYANLIFNYGYEKFFEKCAHTQVNGIIIPDIPYEEQEEIYTIATAHGIDLISLIAPTSHQRIQNIAKDAKGFVYIVSSMGVTGGTSEIHTDLASIVRLVREVTNTPTAIGFGIHTTQQAESMAHIADGVIVGSAIVKIIAQHTNKATAHIYDYVKSMKEAVSRRTVK